MKKLVRLITFKLLAASALGLLAGASQAQDKSASSVIQLPSAGGTVSREEGAFGLNTNTGSANFQLPFPELPTRGKHAPAIQLSYSQFSGDSGSGMGIGWDINVPSIAINSDLGTAIGGFKANGDFFSHLSLAGQRLVFVGKTEDGGGLRYRPEFAEDFIQITYRGTPFSVPVIGPRGEAQTVVIPSGFEVLKPDGMRQYFSGDPAVAEGAFDSASPYATRWPLVLEVNPDRDPITYSYVKHGNRAYLKDIVFAGNRSAYTFELLDTQANLVSNATGARQVNSKLYSRVTASFDGDVYNRWCLGYIGRSGDGDDGFTVRAHPDCLAQAQADLGPLVDAKSINVLDQLRAIYRFGDNGSQPLTASTEALPSIMLSYSSWTSVDLAGRDVVYEAPKLAFAGDIPPANFELADMDMDSLVDVVQSSDAGARILFGEGSLDSSFSQTRNLMLSRDSNAGMRTDVVPRLSDDRFQFADIYGDSFVDMVEIGDNVIYIYAGDSAGNFNYIGREIPVAGISPALFTNGRSRFMDVNMDNQSDIVSTQLNGDGQTEWQVFLNLTRRQPDGEHRVNFGSLQKKFPFASQDGSALAARNARVTDINGDRLPDLVVIQPAQQGFCVYENTGTIFSQDPSQLLFGDAKANDPICGTGSFTPVASMEPTDRLETMWYVDANGDGIMDFASMGTRTDELRVWLGFGDGTFLNNPIDIGLNLRVQVGANTASFRSRVVDLDADGQSEILVFQQPAGNDVKSVVVIDFNRAGETQLAKANLLTTAEFGSGRRYDVRYATSTDEMLRDKANGHPFTKLHFPVVLAKQMVTSEGVPGLPRNLVQTDEYFYHRPFYDVINKRFIGFSEVEKVAYGDEFTAGGGTSQRSSYTNEQYYTFAQTAVDLHLAGKLKISKTYTLQPQAQIVASAEETATLDPSQPFQHSLSTETRGQKLPRPGVQLSCQSAVWEAVAIGDGSSFLRKTSDSLTAATSDQQQQAVTDETCLDPIKVQEYAKFDAFNLAGQITTKSREIAGPLGLTVPGFVSVTRNDFTASRTALADLGIVNAVSERTTLAGTRLMSAERFVYAPTSGRLTNRTLDVFSSLREVPSALATFQLPTRSMQKIFDFDVFGNTVKVSDNLGAVETVVFEPTGVLPLEHRTLNGADAALDQVTKMTYDGERAGLIHTQTTPLGSVITYAYDQLSRKTLEAANDGAEQKYFYKIGKGGLPSLIMTSNRRYRSAADVPAGESEFIDMMSAYNSDGNEIAKIENAADKGIRVFSFKQYNRNKNVIFKWTPFAIASFNGVDDLDVRKSFEIGDIPRPSNAIGTRYAYDEANRPAMEADAAGKVSMTSYHDWGSEEVTTYSDAFSGQSARQLKLLRNEQGLFAQIVSDARGTDHVTTFRRDDFGFLSEILLPGEASPRTYVYNSAGDLESQTIPGMGSYFHFYDPRGRQTVTARIAEDGAKTDIIETDFDFLNRRISERVNGQQTAGYKYDRKVQMASAALFTLPIDVTPFDQPTEIKTFDPNGLFDTVQRYGYDRNGRLAQAEIDLAGKTYSESYSLTLDGRITKSTDPGGMTSIFGMGPDSNLISVKVQLPGAATPESIIDKVFYSPEGRMKRVDYRAGAATDMIYNPETLFLENIKTVAMSEGQEVVLQNLDMAFNQLGSINRITDKAAASPQHADRSGTFEYDFKNQLVRYNRYGEDARFAYAPAGTFSRNDEFEASASLAAASAATGLIPASTPALPYTFDGFGQLSKSPKILSTVFDAHGWLIRATTTEAEIAYGYDQSGRRLYQQITSRQAPAEVAHYLYPMQSFNVGPKGEESFTFIGDQRLVRLEHATGDWFYYLKDHLSSSDFVMNKDGVPVEQMLYRAFGTEHAPESLAPGWATHIEAKADLLPKEKTHHRFTGQYLDDATGLYYYGQRYYDPKLGRFASPDPLYLTDPKKCETNVVACNLFAYANNNPMAFIDPTGLDGVVAGDAAFRKQAEDALQKLDPSARVDAKTGEISQNWLHNKVLMIVGIFSSSAGHNEGRELVSRIIDSSKTTTIEYESPGAATSSPPGQNPNTTPSDATVKWDPAYHSVNAEYNPSTGAVTNVPKIPALVLGHELIHATHRNEGTRDPTVVSYKGIDGKTYSGKIEEIRTVGIGGQNRPGDITENNLREMLGVNPRNNY